MKDLKKEIESRFWKRVKSYLSEDLVQHNDWKIVIDEDVGWLIEEVRKEERKKTLEEVGAYAEVECEFTEQKDKTYKGWLWLESLQEVLSKLKSKGE